MSLINLVKQFVAKNPWIKLKAISEGLGESRGNVVSLLRGCPDVFQENERHEWSVIDAAIPRAVSEVAGEPYSTKESILVENIDLVDRIKEALKANPYKKSKYLADLLNVNRQITNKTLYSFQNVFVKNELHEWSINPRYVDNNTGEDAEFPIYVQVKNTEALLPVVDYAEGEKPPHRVVVEARLNRNFIVLAPPGTGKTHTLIERLVYAITKSNREVDAGELLVLSFTRAAVGEIRERIAKAVEDGAPSGLRYVQVKTFDAYATWLLNDGGYDIAGKTYDARIQLLTKELDEVSLRQATDRIGRSRYLFVDEIQDLVGVRADMVFELVKRILTIKGSVTLLGDPHQSLNDYQIKRGQTDASEFIEKVQNHLAGGLERFELEESHRYETPEMKVLAAQAKKILDNVGLPAKDKFDALVHLIPKVSQAQLMQNFTNSAADALLCRSNGEVYQWLNWHQEQGNQCSVNAGAIGRPWPAWIGQAIIHYQAEVITRDQLIKRLLPNLKGGHAPSIEELDEFLLNERLVRHNIINLEELAFRMKYLSPAKKGDNSESGLIVSTVHKAKGLEYKNVVVVEPKINKKTGVTDEEVRVLYVAITRAKRTISMLAKNDTPFKGWIKKKKGGHLGYAEAGVKYLQVIGLEDFDLETLFINKQGGVDTTNLENYLLTYQEENNYFIRPESCNAENDHNYALYLNSSLGPVRLCFVGKKMKESLDAMAWGNKYEEAGALLDLGEDCNYQTIVHPMQSPILARHIGPAGIMVFPLIQGFYPLSRATGE